MYRRNHLVLRASWWILCVLAMMTGSYAQEIATNVLLPSSRIYGYTTSQQGAVKVSAVSALIKINDTVASTTLQLELENTTAIRQEAEVILPVR